MLISNEQYKECFKYYAPYACVVRSKNIFYFICQQSQSDPAGFKEITQVVSYFSDELEPVDRTGFTKLEGFSRSCGDIAYLPKEQLILSSQMNSIYVLGSGEERLEDELEADINGPSRGITMRIRTIGRYAYMATTRRGVCRRIGVNDWESLCPDLHLTPEQMPKSAREERDLTKDWGFRDIDGLGEEDFYAVGGLGDVWHYVDGDWEQCGFPNNSELYNVCCAPNGDVYIAGHGGQLYKGSKHNWKLAAHTVTTLWFEDMVWYEDALYATNEYGVYVLNGNQWERPTDFPPEAQTSSGSMSVRDGVLLIAGIYGAVFKKDGQWQVIFLRQEGDEMITQQMLEDE